MTPYIKLSREVCPECNSMLYMYVSFSEMLKDKVLNGNIYYKCSNCEYVKK